MSDTPASPPDRLSGDPRSPFFNAELLARGGAYARLYARQAAEEAHAADFVYADGLRTGGVATPITYELDGRQYVAVMGGIQKGFPSAIGKKLPPKIGRYFNSVIQIRKSGMGANVKRELYTSATTDIDLKVSKPSLVPPVLAPDLAKLFELLKQ